MFIYDFILDKWRKVGKCAVGKKCLFLFRHNYNTMTIKQESVERHGFGDYQYMITIQMKRYKGDKNRQKTFLSLRQRGSCTWNLVTHQIFVNLRWLWCRNYGLNHFHQVCGLLPLPPPLLHLDAKKGRIEVAKNQNSCFFSVDCQQQKTSNTEEDDILLGVE